MSSQNSTDSGDHPGTTSGLRRPPRREHQGVRARESRCRPGGCHVPKTCSGCGGRLPRRWIALAKVAGRHRLRLPHNRIPWCLGRPGKRGNSADIPDVGPVPGGRPEAAGLGAGSAWRGVAERGPSADRNGRVLPPHERRGCIPCHLSGWSRHTGTACLACRLEDNPRHQARW